MAALNVYNAAGQGNISGLRALLADNAPTNYRGEGKNTPMHLAATRGHAECVAALLGAGADKEAKNEDKQTPLHLAAWNFRAKCLVALLEAGANTEARDKNRRTPLHSAADNGRVECVTALLRAGADMEAEGEDQLTPLYFAVKNGRTDCVTALLEAGAIREAKTQAQSTLLQVAADNRHTDCMEVLCLAGADIEANQYGNTALGMAIRRNAFSVAVVSVLLEWGADANAAAIPLDRDDSVKPVLQLALDRVDREDRKSALKEIVAALLAHGATTPPGDTIPVEILQAALGRATDIRAALAPPASVEAERARLVSALAEVAGGDSCPSALLSAAIGRALYTKVVASKSAAAAAKAQSSPAPTGAESRTPRLPSVRALAWAKVVRRCAEDAENDAGMCRAVPLLRSVLESAHQPRSEGAPQETLRPQTSGPSTECSDAAASAHAATLGCSSERVAMFAAVMCVAQCGRYAAVRSEAISAEAAALSALEEAQGAADTVVERLSAQLQTASLVMIEEIT